MIVDNSPALCMYFVFKPVFVCEDNLDHIHKSLRAYYDYQFSHLEYRLVDMLLETPQETNGIAYYVTKQI